MSPTQLNAYRGMSLSGKAEYLVRIGEARNYSAAMQQIGSHRRRSMPRPAVAGTTPVGSTNYRKPYADD